MQWTKSGVTPDERVARVGDRRVSSPCRLPSHATPGTSVAPRTGPGFAIRCAEMAARSGPRRRAERRSGSRATFYDRLSVFYDWIAEASEGKPRQHALQALGAGQGDKVLEIGVGTGRALPSLVRGVGAGGRVFGIDVSPGMLRVAVHHSAALKLRERVALQRADARALPYRSQTLDAVFMSFTLELFGEGDIPLVLREVWRALRPGGRVGVVSLVEGKPRTRSARLYRWFRRRWPRLIDCRPIPLEADLAQAGFRLQSSEGLDVSGLPVRAVIAVKPSSSP